MGNKIYPYGEIAEVTREKSDFIDLSGVRLKNRSRGLYEEWNNFFLK